MVHLEAEKEGIERVAKEDLPQLGEVLRRGWHLLLSLVILVALLIFGFTPMLAAFWARRTRMKSSPDRPLRESPARSG